MKIAAIISSVVPTPSKSTKNPVALLSTVDMSDLSAVLIKSPSP